MKALGSFLDSSALGWPKDSGDLVVKHRDQRLKILITEGVDEATAAGFLDEIERLLRQKIRLCESPIECSVMIAFAFGVTEFGKDVACLVDCREAPLFPKAETVLIPQFRVGPYRLDFCLRTIDRGGFPRLAAIECDGKEFHETLQQKDRDFVRDVFLRSLGVETYRLTGSEIFKKDAALVGRLRQIISETKEC